jgi:plasmid stability protein
MGNITIRDLEHTVKAKLLIRAAQNGRSIEEKARSILRAGLAENSSEPTNLYDAIRRRIEPLGGVELDLPARDMDRKRPTFD